MISPYATAGEVLNQHAILGPFSALRRQLAKLTAGQTRDDKLERALEEGRCYGMRQMRLEIRQQKLLAQKLKGNALTAPSFD